MRSMWRWSDLPLHYPISRPSALHCRIRHVLWIWTIAWLWWQPTDAIHRTNCHLCCSTHGLPSIRTMQPNVVHYWITHQPANRYCAARPSPSHAVKIDSVLETVDHRCLCKRIAIYYSSASVCLDRRILHVPPPPHCSQASQLYAIGCYERQAFECHTMYETNIE